MTNKTPVKANDLKVSKIYALGRGKIRESGVFLYRHENICKFKVFNKSRFYSYHNVLQRIRVAPFVIVNGSTLAVFEI